MELYHEIAGHGETVVLVHAGIVDSRMWDPQWPLLTERYRTLRYDMRGFGRSPLPAEPYAHARDLSELLDGLEIDRAALVAVSMGGRVALELAVARPRLVSALMLVGSGLPGHHWSQTVQSYGQSEDDAISRGDIDEAVELNLRMWFDGPGRTSDQVDAAVRAKAGEMQRRAFELQIPVGEAADEELLVEDMEQRLGEIAVPTLVAVGEHDVSDMHEIAEQLESAIPGAHRHDIAGAAHIPNMEQPAQFDELMLGFLAGR
jgi:3-oxoadipate enol-lactonase